MISSHQRNRVLGAVPTYSLQKGLEAWELVFEGRRAVLRHEQGIVYVAYLLAHPSPEPIHALDLLLRLCPARKGSEGITELVDSGDGKRVVVGKNARLQERGLGLESAESLRALRQRERDLEAMLDNDDESEPVKAEALRELEEIARARRKPSQGAEDGAQKAARAVRRAVRRFYSRLAAATDGEGRPHPVLHRFAQHLQHRLLIPSARYCSLKTARPGASLAGRLIYEPPPGVEWERAGE